MKLLVLSDLHLEFCALELPSQLQFDVALLAGDIVCPGRRAFDWVSASPVLQRAAAVLLVPGNHEYYDSTLQDEAARMHEAAARSRQPPVFVLDGDSRVIDGVRFIGCTLWTDFELRIDTADGAVVDRERGMAEALRAMVDYRAIDVRSDVAAAERWRKLGPHDTLRLHREQRAWLEQALAAPFDGPTVVITHHGPHRDSLATRFADDWVSTAFISELPAHFFEVPSLWVHGHTHTSFDYRVGNCRVLCNPRGYQLRGMTMPENPRFDPGLVVELG
jgi:predicted phosphodiesterase